jgi:predicted ATPase
LPGKRLVTTTGTGGMGKTAVALVIAQKLADTLHDGHSLLFTNMIRRYDLC